MKRFLEWINLKIRLDSRQPLPPFVSEGDIWWINMGENIGREIGGKNELFTRPVIIFKKLASDFYFVIPLTTQAHAGTWYVSLSYNRKEMTACLHQARSIDYRRLDKKLGELDGKTYQKIKDRFKALYI